MTALPRPINKVGTTKMRWAAWQRKQRAAVMARCRGICEVPDCDAPAREWHHVYSRRQIISEPLASHESMTAGLCRECHREVTLNPKSENAVMLQRTAIDRASWPFDFDGPEDWNDEANDPMGWARRLESCLKETGQWVSLCEEAGK